MPRLRAWAAYLTLSWKDTRVRMFRMSGCAGLLVVLAGCGGSGDPSAGTVTTQYAAASTNPTSITVLVVFVGGPADGRTERLPLSQAAGGVTISGVTYRGRPGPPPEVKNTSEGLAEVLRPV